MSVKVQIPGPMRQHTGGKSTVEATGNDVRAVLENLSSQFPGLRERILDGEQVRRFVNVFVNNEDIRYLDSLATPVKDGDDLAIIPAVAGG
jgi:molybdopterin synthase sulfur carrier subunit